MTITQYIDRINQRYRQGNSTEYTFRGDVSDIKMSYLTNEPNSQNGV
jgi:hypothetical protein